MLNIDNKAYTLKEDLEKELKKGSKVSMAAAYFSMYAYKELKEKLNDIEEFRFIFTQPTFTPQSTNKKEREFYIPKIDRESSLHGTEFEVRLKNEIKQKAISKECADWIREKAIFKSNLSNLPMMNTIRVENEKTNIYLNVNGFTTSHLGVEKGNEEGYIYTKFSGDESKAYLKSFEDYWNSDDKLQDVTEEIIESLNSAYKENPPELIYYITLYNVFNESAIR